MNPTPARDLVLTRHQARELLALIRDIEGDADEDVLDIIASKLRLQPAPASAMHRDRAEAGEVLIVRLGSDETDALIALIDDDDIPADILDTVATGIDAALTRRRPRSDNDRRPDRSQPPSNDRTPRRPPAYPTGRRHAS